jgi:hypothetical protein
MSPLPPTARPFFRWMLPGLLGGLLVGGGATWWAMRRQVDGEARRLARVMAEEAAGPRAPTPLAGAGGRAGSGKAGAVSGAGAVPVIEVADNLEESFKALLAIADPAVRQAALAKFLEKLPIDRWPAFLASAKKMGDRGEFEDNPGSVMAVFGVMESVLSFMVQRSPEGLLSGVMETRDGQELNDDSDRDDGVAMTALRFWAGQDLPAAMVYFEKNLRSLPPGKQVEAAKGLAREFVKKDPAAAFAWIKGLPKENQAQVAHGAFQTLSHTDSEAALKFLVTEKELPNRDEFAEQMAKGWAATKPEEALAWAKGLPEDLSARAVQGAMEHLAEKNFDAALKEVAALTPAQQDGALKALADNITDPSRVAGVLQLVEQSPEGPGRMAATMKSLHEWTRADPEAASAWLAAQPDGPTRDGAIAGFGGAAVVSKNDPVAGLEWTTAISDSRGRGEALRANIKNWADYDPEAARAWVQSSPRLSDADREVLLPMTRK